MYDMRYKIKQKIFTLADNFTIKDEFDMDRYIVKGKIFTIGRKLKIEDLGGRELIYIEQKVFRLLSEYNIFSQGNRIAWVKQEFSFFKPKIKINSIYGNYRIIGNFLGLDYQVIKDGNIVATVSKKWLSLADTYMVDINDNEDQAFILSLAIVIDQIIDDVYENN